MITVTLHAGHMLLWWEGVERLADVHPPSLEFGIIFPYVWGEVPLISRSYYGYKPIVDGFSVRGCGLPSKVGG